MSAVITDEVLEEDSTAEMIAKRGRLLRTAMQALSDIQIIDAALAGEKIKPIREQDENGEPTWNYLVKVALPADFRMTKRFLAYGSGFNFNPESMHTLMHGKDTYEGFIGYYSRTKTKWANWSLVFMKWVRSEHDRKTKKEAGRLTRFDQQRTRV